MKNLGIMLIVYIEIFRLSYQRNRYSSTQELEDKYPENTQGEKLVGVWRCIYQKIGGVGIWQRHDGRAQIMMIGIVGILSFGMMSSDDL